MQPVHSAFVRQGVVTVLDKVANGDATFADEVGQFFADLGYRAMSRLSILYRASETRFPAVRKHLDANLPEELQQSLTSGVSRPAAPRRAPMRLPRFGLILRRLETAAIVAVLAAGAS